MREYSVVGWGLGSVGSSRLRQIIHCSRDASVQKRSEVGEGVPTLLATPAPSNLQRCFFGGKDGLDAAHQHVETNAKMEGKEQRGRSPVVAVDLS